MGTLLFFLGLLVLLVVAVVLLIEAGETKHRTESSSGLGWKNSRGAEKT